MPRYFTSTHARSRSIFSLFLAAASGCILGCESRNELARVTEERDHLDTQVLEMRQKVDALEQDLRSTASDSEAAARIQSLRSENDQLREDLNKKNDANAKAERHLASLRQDFYATRDDAESAKKRVAALAKENDELKELLEEFNNPLSRFAISEWKLAQSLQGATLLAQDGKHTFLGVLDFTGTDLDSIFNEVGLHGSDVAMDSIWNDVGFYGSEVGLWSARNDLCMTPPVLVKRNRIIGYVTTNDLYPRSPRLNPYYLLSLATRLRE